MYLVIYFLYFFVRNRRRLASVRRESKILTTHLCRHKKTKKKVSEITFLKDHAGKWRRVCEESVQIRCIENILCMILLYNMYK